MKRSYRFIRCTAAAVTAAVMFSGPFAAAQDAITPAKSDGMTEAPKSAEAAPAEKKAEAKKEEKKSSRKKAEAPRTFTLNFKDIEISEFLNFMGRLIGKNIIIDDNVRGKISIISNREVPLSEAFEVTKAILEVKGFAIVETANLMKVMPIKEAIKKNVDIVVDGKELDESKQKTMTYLLELQNADAAQLAQAMQPLKSQFTDIVVYPTLNTIIFSGSSTEIEGLLKIARALDKAPEKAEVKQKERGNIHVVPLEYANAEDLANVLSRVPFSEVAFVNTEDPASQVRQSAAANRIAGQPMAQQQQNKSKLSIIASKEANALIVTATPKEFEEIERLIKKLDVVREQVLIEALIVEVAADNGWNWGIDWEVGQDLGSVAVGGSTIFSSKASNFTSPVSGKTVALPQNQGFQLGFLASNSILSFGLLNMAKSDSNANILSTPQILTTDNQEAEINVGDQIAVSTSTTSTTTTTTSYDYKSVGVKLKLTPHITNNDRISLDLYMEVNDIIGNYDSQTATKPPQLSKRDIKTKITVPNTKTVVVGGLIKNKKSMSESKVPFLGDIPLLGWLFTNKSVQNNKTNLLVFITPTLLTKPENMEIVTKQKKEEQKLLLDNKD